MNYLKKSLLCLFIGASFIIACGDDDTDPTTPSVEAPKEGTKGGACRAVDPKCDPGFVCDTATHKCKDGPDDPEVKLGYVCEADEQCLLADSQDAYCDLESHTCKLRDAE